MKLIIQLLILVTVISTICLCISKPTMHKSVLIYNSDFNIETEQVTSVEETEMPTYVQSESADVQMTADEKIDNQIALQEAQYIQYAEQKLSEPNVVDDSWNTVSNNTQTKTVTSTNKTTPSSPIRQIVVNPSTVTETQSKNTVKLPASQHKAEQVFPKNVQQTVAQNDVSAPVGNNTKTVSAPIGNSTKTVQNPTVSIPKTTTTTASAPKPIVLTPQEEEIAWNRWRSNLQNQIMKDSTARLPNVPNGTIFTFKFTVDKYGKISNLNTSSTSPQYVPYAIQYVMPVIRGYQGHSILNFPHGSTRTVTEVSGKWRVSVGTKNSTQYDYNDIEKVRR